MLRSNADDGRSHAHGAPPKPENDGRSYSAGRPPKREPITSGFFGGIVDTITATADKVVATVTGAVDSAQERAARKLGDDRTYRYGSLEDASETRAKGVIAGAFNVERGFLDIGGAVDIATGVFRATNPVFVIHDTVDSLADVAGGDLGAVRDVPAVGNAIGIYEGARDLATGVIELGKLRTQLDPVTNPGGFIGAWKQFGSSVSHAITNPIETAELTFAPIIEDVSEGRFHEAAGRIGFEIGVAVLTSGLGKASASDDALRGANAVDEVLRAGSSAVDDAARSGTNVASAGTRVADDLGSLPTFIHPYRQDKHLAGLPNNRNDVKFKSGLTHASPQSLLDEFAGTGTRKSGAIGSPGYVELVNFGETIGTSFQVVGVKADGIFLLREMSTPWGQIHYGANGAHIVPVRPPGVRAIAPGIQGVVNAQMAIKNVSFENLFLKANAIVED